METYAEKIANRCVYFNGISHKTCDAGVTYESVRVDRPFPSNFPCWKSGDSIHSIPCEKRRFPTEEEVAAKVRESDDNYAKLKKAYSTAAADAKSRGWGKGIGGGAATIKCPCCTDGTLWYSIANYNGHIHGKCSTKDCVSWMQ